MAVNVADPVLWITWYHLAPAARDEYLQWLHSATCRSSARPGVMWAAHYASEKQPVLL